MDTNSQFLPGSSKRLKVEQIYLSEPTPATSDSSFSDQSDDESLQKLSVKFYKEKLKSMKRKMKKLKKDKDCLDNENKRLDIEVAALKEENHRLLVENYSLKHLSPVEKLIPGIPTADKGTLEALESSLQSNGDRLFTKFNILLTKQNITSLETVPLSSKNDSKYVYKLLDFLFPIKEELAYASATGKSSKNPRYEQRSFGTLDENRLEFIRSMYKVRVESSGDGDGEERLKKFNNYVNIKIQNTRKGLDIPEQRFEIKEEVNSSEYVIQE